MDKKEVTEKDSVIQVFNDKGWAVVRLNRPKALQALNTEMVTSLKKELEDIAVNPDIKAVWIESTSAKAFCAGGDVRSVRQHILEGDIDKANAFFQMEYALDLMLHDYPKPIVAYADGYIMGGGMGILMACPYRVITSKSMIAMPEISIGLFPDVGGSLFLAQKKQLGLFLALTGCMLNATDTFASGFATHIVHVSSKDVLAELKNNTWDKGTSNNQIKEDIEKVLKQSHQTIESIASNIPEISDVLNQLGSDFFNDLKLLQSLIDSNNKWLAQAITNLMQGSITSVALSWLLWQWGVRKIADDENNCWQAVFALEAEIVKWKIQHADFAEGVRARLVDKDMQPNWQVDFEQLSHLKLNEILPELPKTDDKIWQSLLLEHDISFL